MKHRSTSSKSPLSWAGCGFKAWKFLLRLMYWGREFAWLYQRCDKLAFLDGHVRALADLGGIRRAAYTTILSAAVRKTLDGERRLTNASKRWSAITCTNRALPA
jgi:hypothetical protein